MQSSASTSIIAALLLEAGEAPPKRAARTRATGIRIDIRAERFTLEKFVTYGAVPSGEGLSFRARAQAHKAAHGTSWLMCVGALRRMMGRNGRDS